jgi:hypothetical protein
MEVPRKMIPTLPASTVFFRSMHQFNGSSASSEKYSDDLIKFAV